MFKTGTVLNAGNLIPLYQESDTFASLCNRLRQLRNEKLFLQGLAGSSAALLCAASIRTLKQPTVAILNDREAAAHFFNDLENLLGEKDLDNESRSIFFFPSAYKKAYSYEDTDNANVQIRAELISRLAEEKGNIVVVSYPEALAEKVIARKTLKKQSLGIRTGDRLSMDFLLDALVSLGFEQSDFVTEPGQFCLRGGIMDVYSFSNDLPYRIEMLGDTIESLRTFDPNTQVSTQVLTQIGILPNIEKMHVDISQREFLLDSMPGNVILWSEDSFLAAERAGTCLKKAIEQKSSLHPDINHALPETLFAGDSVLLEAYKKLSLVEFGRACLCVGENQQLSFRFSPQPSFNKNFELLIKNMEEQSARGIHHYILSDNPRQLQRIETIFETLLKTDQSEHRFSHSMLNISLSQGFIDHENAIACYTDHQIFERYHRFRLRESFKGKQAMTLREISNLKPGDFITHIDHGIGIFSGLEKIEVNGRMQEAIRLIYKGNDILYISIHSLHRISKYTGKEGTPPVLHRLGSGTWSRIKSKTKQKVKDIARDLIALYAKRKARQGFAFSPDTYLQNELEASFIFEDTPDQLKATNDVKKDMEAPCPMDRLICGDVGFGKTEVAIRAAFKAVADSKQVAVLVPTTILALQHYHTFSERLKGLPCTVDYLNRFRSAKSQKEILEKTKQGKIDILIGTHRLISKDVQFRDLGLLIIDEEQKFGVSAKEKLKQIRVDVDTLTLSATPIPRTLQFSLMGARDLSLITTPPANRYPILTELHIFNEALLRDAIMVELNRAGQVFFVHNRVENITEMAGILQRLCPDARIAIGHGQLDGTKLEQIMIDFIEGYYDILVSTTIIESGLDISNANTIIINNAHHFGLSDLHQLRGRVGRSNKKAFCYLLTPPMSTLTDEARKRLRTIEEFSELGSGFNIAMRDLEIRGAGNILGAEQSGFISEIGFEMYHKILDEALAELRTEVATGFDSAPEIEVSAVSECTLETDLELMIPSDYVSNTQERLNLYKELDAIENGELLNAFANRLSDRFGPLPDQTSGLLEAVRLRWLAKKNGFEKLILKGGKMIAHFPGSKDSSYYDSPIFRQILAFAQENPRRCLLKESGDKLSLTIQKAGDIDQALQIMKNIAGMEN